MGGGMGGGMSGGMGGGGGGESKSSDGGGEGEGEGGEGGGDWLLLCMNTGYAVLDCEVSGLPRRGPVYRYVTA
jgi:hypothetical protein